MMQKMPPMPCARLRMWVGGMVLLAGLCAAPLRAQEGAAGGTALGLLNSGMASYGKGDYRGAEGYFNKFMADYGRAQEAAPYQEPVMRMLCYCKVQLKDYEGAVEPITAYLGKFQEMRAREDLTFFLGVAQLKSGKTVEALAAFEKFEAEFPQSVKAAESRMLRLLARVAGEQWAEAVELARSIRGGLTAEGKLTSQVLELYALLQADRKEEALALVRDFPSGSDDLEKISAFHVLALDLGNRLLDAGQYRPALEALQRVWPRARILARQDGRIGALKEKLKGVADHEGSGAYERFGLEERVSRLEEERQRVEEIKGYDEALGFRIAECFFRLERYREAHLKYRQMLADLPDSEMVMQGNYRLLMCLVQMERWEEVVAAAGEFAGRFAKSPLRPQAAYLAAEAQMRRMDYPAAVEAFRGVAKEFPDFGEAERCHFLAGYCLMMADRNAEAILQFDGQGKRWPRGPFITQAAYWQAMAWFYLKDYARARTAFQAFMKSYPDDPHWVDCRLRAAHCLFGMKDYPGAAAELREFLGAHGAVIQADEARNLLGDSLLAVGEIDDGIAAYQAVTETNPRLYEYAYFRVAEAYKAMERYEDLRRHCQAFVDRRTGSGRMAEALAHLAWLHKTMDQDTEKARAVYWRAARELGNDPESVGVEEALFTLAKLYPGEERARLDVELSDLAEEAGREGKKTLQTRAVWMRAQLAKKSKPEDAAALLARLPGIAPCRSLSPRMLADAGDALRVAGKNTEARECYRTILAWYPQSLFKDRGHAGLGLLAKAEGRAKEALEAFDNFERQTVQSPLLAEVLRARADLHMERGEWPEAAAQLNRILEVPAARGLPWVKALYDIGTIYQKQGDAKKAIPYFQRIYVMYGRWGDYVAKSYWESGQAFEKLNMRQEAVNTYKELLENAHLSGMPEYKSAQERLAQLGGGA
jgi:tetratricopeptide (TPR) repeat protein